MQQTKLDRWLRSKYAYTTHVYANTKPATLSSDVTVEEYAPELGKPYRYRITSADDAVIEELTAQLSRENITYTSRVEDRDEWYSKWINNPQKSFTYRLVWLVAFLLFVGIAVSPLPRLVWSFLDSPSAEQAAK